jgi:vancomycin aglycone glucosyltransferase
MRVTLTSHGSTGDIYPVIAVGVALQKAGHQVRFATLASYQAEIEAAGLTFYSLCPTWDRPDLSYWMGRLQKIRTPIYQLREIYVGAKKHIPEMLERMDAIMPETDILVSSYLFPINRGIADRHRVPFATLAFAPHVVPSADYPPENIPSPLWLGRTTRRAWNRWLWSMANTVVDWVINTCIHAELKAAHLPQVREFFSNSAECVLVTVSPAILRPPGAELDARFKFVGYCRWQSPESPAIDAELRAFTGGERVPVLTFGSMVYDNPDAWMTRFIRAWPRNRKIIVQSGWTQFPQLGLGEHIKVIGKVSHDQLFQHASAVIHHGGAGTTASAFYAGVPQIVVPHIGDQPFFGREVERLGCGLVIRKNVWPEQLHPALIRLADQPTYVLRAEAVRTQLLAENGPANAVTMLERFVAEYAHKPATGKIPPTPNATR